MSAICIGPPIEARLAPIPTMSRWKPSPKLLRRLAWTPPLILATQWVGTIKEVTGRSMQPTLNPDTSPGNDFVVADRFSVIEGRVKAGDIVILKSPTNPNALITKRVVALGGDIVHTLPPYPQGVVQVPPNHAWVEGDEPFVSRDSNSFGPVSLGLVDSVVRWIVWPPQRWGPANPPVDVTATPKTRKEVDDLARENRRTSRVVVFRGPPPVVP